MAVFVMLSLVGLANVNLFNGGESPLGWRPGDLLPRRFRFRDSIARGDTTVDANNPRKINTIDPAFFRTHEQLRSRLHKTELVEYGISTEGHVMKARPIMEVSQRLVDSMTAAPPPPPSEEEQARVDKVRRCRLTSG